MDDQEHGASSTVQSRPQLIRVVIVEATQPMVDAIVERISRDPLMIIVGTSTNGLEAIDLYEAHTPDALVMYTHLDGLDAISATEEIKRRHPSAKIVITTVHDDPVIVSRAFEAGVAAYMILPITSEEFSNVLRAIVGPRPPIENPTSSAA